MWTCNNCTFENKNMKAKKCLMCLVVQPSPPAAAPPAAAPPAAEEDNELNYHTSASGHDYIGKYILSNEPNSRVRGIICGYISDTDIDVNGNPAYTDDVTGEPAFLFYAVFHDNRCVELDERDLMGENAVYELVSNEDVWPKKSHMEKLSLMLPSKSFIDLCSTLVSGTPDSVKLQSINICLREAEVPFVQGESIGVGFVNEGEKLLLEIINAHTAGYVVIIWVRVSPLGWKPIYMNYWLSQTRRAVAGFVRLDELFPNEEMLMFPDISEAIGLKRYDVDESVAYEDMKAKVQKINKAGKKCAILMIDINRLHGKAQKANMLVEELKDLGAVVVPMRQFQYPEGGEHHLSMERWVEVQGEGLGTYMQHWEEMMAAEEREAEGGGSKRDAARALRNINNLTQDELDFQAVVNGEQEKLYAELENKKNSDAYNWVVSAVSNGNGMNGQSDFATPIVQFVAQLLNELDEVVTDERAEQLADEYWTVVQGEDFTNKTKEKKQFTNIVLCRQSRSSGQNKVINIKDVDCVGLSLEQMAYCYAYLKKVEGLLQETGESAIVHARVDRDKKGNNNFVWLCEMAALKKVKRVLAQNSPRISSHKSYIVFLGKICKLAGVELIGVDHIGLTVEVVAEEERTRPKANATTFKAKIGNLFDSDVSKQMLAIVDSKSFASC